MSLQFDQLSAFSVVHAGLLWEKFRNKFPLVEYKGTLAPTFETFGSNRPGTPQIRLQFAEAPDLPRLWFIDETSSQLVQFQQDRFIHNWRKVGNGANYPRYEAIRAKFVDELAALQTFLSEQGLGEIMPNQCELTYVSMLRIPAGIAPLKFLVPGENPHVGEFEDAAAMLRYRLNNEEGKPVGRITIQASPGVDPNGENVTQLTITGRGPPAEKSIPASMAFLDSTRCRRSHVCRHHYRRNAQLRDRKV